MTSMSFNNTEIKSRTPNNGNKKNYSSAPVSEKVKEIKKRQENWMKQRANQITKEDCSRTEIKQHVSDEINSDSDEDACCKTSTSPARPKGGSTNIQHKFKHWLEKRSEPNTESVKIDNSFKQHQYGNYNTCGDDDIVKLQDRLLSTKDFDAKADSIVDKVRKDLNIYSSMSEEEPLNRSKSCFENRDHHKPDKSMSNNLSSHHCPACLVSMGLSEHTPMLLIPCGHSVCKLCSKESHLCAVCHCSVNSVTCNIMLQQIIQEYNRQHPPTYTRRHSAKTTSQYSSSQYDSRLIQNKGSHRMKYEDELNNLETRIEIMNSEKQSVKQEIINTGAKIKAEQKQLKNIVKEKENIQMKIQELQDKAKVLTQHEKEYHEKCNILLEENVELTDKMVMLNNTLTGLSQEEEKVRFLMESDEI